MFQKLRLYSWRFCHLENCVSVTLFFFFLNMSDVNHDLFSSLRCFQTWSLCFLKLWIHLSNYTVSNALTFSIVRNSNFTWVFQSLSPGCVEQLAPPLIFRSAACVGILKQKMFQTHVTLGPGSVTRHLGSGSSRPSLMEQPFTALRLTLQTSDLFDVSHHHQRVFEVSYQMNSNSHRSGGVVTVSTYLAFFFHTLFEMTTSYFPQDVCFCNVL